MDEELARRVVALAVRAPSVHNTQPWRFTVTATGLDLYADRSRQLPVLDPTGRLLTISCGAAVGMARLAARALGYATTVELMPDEDDLDRLARLTVGPPLAAGSDELALVREVARRRTVRDRFDTVPLASAARTVLGRDAETEQAWLYWVDDTAQRVTLAVLSDRADRIQQADPAMRAELARWRRDDDTAGDGIPRGVLPQVPPALRATDVPLREFAPPGGPPGGADPQHLPLPAERPDLAILGTRYEGPMCWLQAGQALSRVLLRATELGLAASPLGQVLDLPWTRRQLRAELGLTGHPQLVLRLGHAQLDGRRTPRRPVAAVVTVPT